MSTNSLLQAASMSSKASPKQLLIDKILSLLDTEDKQLAFLKEDIKVSLELYEEYKLQEALKYLEYYVHLTEAERENYDINIYREGISLYPAKKIFSGEYIIPTELPTCYRFMAGIDRNLQYSRDKDGRYLSLCTSDLSNKNCSNMFSGSKYGFICDLSNVLVNEETDVNCMFSNCVMDLLILNSDFSRVKNSDSLVGSYVYIEEVRNCPAEIVEIIKKYNVCETCKYSAI